MGTGRSDPTNGNGLSMQKVKNKIKSLPSLRNCNRYPTVSLSSSLSPFAVLGTISLDSFSFPSCQVIFARLSTPLIHSLSLSFSIHPFHLNLLLVWVCFVSLSFAIIITITFFFFLFPFFVASPPSPIQSQQQQKQSQDNQ